MLNWDWSCFCPHRWTQMGLDGARWTKWTSSVIPFVTHTAISTQMADAWYVCPWTRGTWRQTHYPSYVSKWASPSRERWNSFSFCHRSGHLYWVGFDRVFQFSSISQSSHKLPNMLMRLSLKLTKPEEVCKAEREPHFRLRHRLALLWFASISLLPPAGDDGERLVEDAKGHPESCEDGEESKLDGNAGRTAGMPSSAVASV